jgi:hypothetical protein
MERTKKNSHTARVAASCLLVCSLVSPAAACVSVPNYQNLADASDRAVNILDDGISALSGESADWRSTLEGITSELTEDAQSTIRNEVTDLMNRSIAAVGTEVKCLVDFAGTRVRQGLVSIRAKILGLETQETEPIFCDTVPMILEREQIPNRTNVLEFYGYDFDRSDIKLMLIKASGSVDVTDKLDRPTHYHMTLNLGANGVQITEDSQRILVRWKDKDLSTIGIVQESPRICKVMTTTVRDIQPFTVIPSLVFGDPDFGGHGPEFKITTNRLRRHDAVSIRMIVTASETREGDTRASGREEVVIYNAPAGYRIDQVLGPSNDHLDDYADGDHDQKTLFRGSGGPVNRYVIDGDRSGGDVGEYTQVTAYFNPLKLVLKEWAGECVSPISLRKALQRGQLSPSLDRLVRPQLDALPDEIKSLPEATVDSPK